MKIGIITQARMTSTRLPGKIFLELGKKSVLENHIDRLRWSELPTYVAATSNSADSVIEDFCKQKGISYFRGSEQNVLERYYQVAQKHGLDIIVRVTSDCPLIDGKLIKQAVDQYQVWADDSIYYSNCLERTFPRGFDFEIFSFKLLKDAHKNAVIESDLEHVTPYINQNKSGIVKIKHYKDTQDNSQFRITLDTEADYDLLKILFDEYACSEKSCHEVIQILKENPNLVKINSHVSQKKV